MSAKTFIVSLVVLEVYIWLGALLFYAVDFSDLTKRDVTDAEEVSLPDLLEELKNLTKDKEPTANEIIDHLETVMKNNSIDRKRQKMTTTEALIASRTFAATVVSTIGYGIIVPRTGLGKILVFFYALIGIPLCLAGLADLGSKMGRYAFVMTVKLLKYLKLKATFMLSHFVALGISISLGTTLWILIPSIIYSHVEGWTYLDAFYYNFVSVSTIGFGDIAPRIDYGILDYYKTAMLVFYIPFRTVTVVGGLAWLATVASIMKEILEHVFHKKEPTTNHQNS